MANKSSAVCVFRGRRAESDVVARELRAVSIGVYVEKTLVVSPVGVNLELFELFVSLVDRERAQEVTLPAARRYGGRLGLF